MPKRTYNVLSLDGGGIRGLLTAILLERLEQMVPGWLCRADLIAGTSTGGIIALGLASGLTPSDLRTLYQDKGPAIFDDSWWDDVKDLGGLSGADYDNANLTRELKRLFGDRRLRDLGKRVLVPAFDLDNQDPDPARRSWKPKLFHNFPGSDSDGAQLVYKVALYTSAAPTYFPTVDGHIDGGVFANNPSMAALAQTRDPRAYKTTPPLSSLRLLSAGSGRSLARIEGDTHDWGYAQWGRPIIGIMMEGSMGVADYQCGQILGGHYHRVEPVFAPGIVIKLDDVGKIPEIVRLAEEYPLEKTAEWLVKQWGEPISPLSRGERGLHQALRYTQDKLRRSGLGHRNDRQGYRTEGRDRHVHRPDDREGKAAGVQVSQNAEP